MEQILIYTFLGVRNECRTNLEKTKQIDTCVVVSNLLLDPRNVLC